MKHILASGKGYDGRGDETTEHLYIGHNNLTWFPRFPNLTHLDIGHNLIQDISDLPHKLQWFCCADNPIDDFSPIESLNLETLWAHDTDYIPENFSPYLKNLLLDRTPPFDYELLYGLPLETLELEGHNFKDLTIVQGMSNLEFLNLEGNKVTDITPLKNMTSLRRLNISGCPIKDYSPLNTLSMHLTKLKV